MLFSRYLLVFALVSINCVDAIADDQVLTAKQQMEIGPYQTAAFHVGWMPKLNIVENESKLAARLGAEVFNRLREAEKTATDIEVAERIALQQRLAATTSNEGKLQQLNDFILKSQERGREFRESVDELVSPADIEFIVRLRGTNFDTFDPWDLASIGADKATIDKVNQSAMRRAQDWVSLIKAQQGRKLTAVESDLDDAMLLTRHRVDVLKLLTMEQQQKVMHVSFGLPPTHSKTDLSNFLEKRKAQFDSNDKTKRKVLDEFKDLVMSAIKYD